MDIFPMCQAAIFRFVKTKNYIIVKNHVKFNEICKEFVKTFYTNTVDKQFQEIVPTLQHIQNVKNYCISRCSYFWKYFVYSHYDTQTSGLKWVLITYCATLIQLENSQYLKVKRKLFKLWLWSNAKVISSIL